MEEPGRASVDLRYKITEEDYVEFNQIIFKKETEGKRKRRPKLIRKACAGDMIIWSTPPSSLALLVCRV